MSSPLGLHNYSGTTTSYGYNDKEFISIVSGSVIIFDQHNRWYTSIENIGSLTDFRNQIKNHRTDSIIVIFAV